MSITKEDVLNFIQNAPEATLNEIRFDLSKAWLRIGGEAEKSEDVYMSWAKLYRDRVEEMPETPCKIAGWVVDDMTMIAIMIGNKEKGVEGVEACLDKEVVALGEKVNTVFQENSMRNGK